MSPRMVIRSPRTGYVVAGAAGLIVLGVSVLAPGALRLVGPVLGAVAVAVVLTYGLIGHYREVRATAARAEDYAARQKGGAP